MLTWHSYLIFVFPSYILLTAFLLDCFVSAVKTIHVSLLFFVCNYSKAREKATCANIKGVSSYYPKISVCGN